MFTSNNYYDERQFMLDAEFVCVLTGKMTTHQNGFFVDRTYQKGNLTFLPIRLAHVDGHRILWHGRIVETDRVEMDSPLGQFVLNEVVKLQDTMINDWR